MMLGVNEYSISSDIYIYIGKRISKKRKEFGMTGEELAKLVHVSQQQISRYERGESQINLVTLLKISTILSTSLSWFLQDILQ